MPGGLKIGLIVGAFVLAIGFLSVVFSGDKPDEQELIPTPAVNEALEVKENEPPKVKENEAPEETQTPEVAGIADDLVEVTKVVDGDTFKIAGDTVRLIGIDTPETVHPSKPVECFGKEASDKLKELLTGKKVKLEKDVSETDRYNRLLRYVYLDGTFVNELMVREGFANAVSYPPDVKHQDLFREAEREARENKRGLWSGVCDEVAVTVAPKAQAEPVQEPAKSTVDCSADVYNCGDFSTCAEVMEVFNACPSDVHKLDRDGDGVPCESLCG